MSNISIMYMLYDHYCYKYMVDEDSVFTERFDDIKKAIKRTDELIDKTVVMEMFDGNSVIHMWDERDK